VEKTLFSTLWKQSLLAMNLFVLEIYIPNKQEKLTHTCIKLWVSSVFP
jgi:hypothetical protein